MDRLLRSILSDTPAGRAYLERMDAAKKRKRARHRPTRVAKEGKRAAKRDETYLLRIQAFELSGGKCVTCNGRLSEGWHLHHIHGAGVRLASQSIYNVAPLCPVCHERIHASDLGPLVMLREWAASNGDDAAWRELNHRIAKIEEARRTA